ncbi:hypothetical protein Deipe_4123 (plasmid) [Deinococcus peraridilitoris DSM 19664]|uniref:Transcription factor zinc-finger domain-containing protein n=1 Tax=Deinococcus peraridilitoris (strain DSM 19664 / LMG 22246 / CIP 109416 / KR-200) TaxID=937777 RepID=L0A8U7_DEIPD|nr:hypothetical protein Deipe_4123 [Deinococcus peraridilitoris DSM 19664]
MAYHMGTECLICEGSPLFFRRASDSHTLFLFCPECDSVWLDPSQLSAEQARFPEFEHRWVIPGTEFRIKGGGARWASGGEIEQVGWGHLVVGTFEESEF